MVSADHVRAALRTSWHRTIERCQPLGDGEPTAWQVSAGPARFIVKLVPAARRQRCEAGLAAAEWLGRAGIAAGAPVRAADGALTVESDGGRLTLQHWVPGRSLAHEDPIDQQFWGDGLAAVHRTLRGFTHPGLPAFHRVRPDAAHLDVEAWVRPAVSAAVAAVTRLCVTDQLTYGVLHGDPSPQRFRLDLDTGRIGLVDWESVTSGPLVYDLAAAVGYAGGTRAAADLLDGYLSTGLIGADECDAALPVLLRLRWAVRVDRLARRIARDGGAAEHRDGLRRARAALGEDGG